MAAAAAGIFNQYLTQGQGAMGKAASLTSSGLAAPESSATAATSGSSSGSSSSSSGNSATISANDFLTLLVTEMQNQDPTATTDPNEYINQLVQVNSLEQLISINQTLTAASTGAGASTAGSGANTNAAAQAAAALGNVSPTAGSAANTLSAFSPAQSGPEAVVAEAATGAQPTAIQYAPGNLTARPAKPAAAGVAHALDGRWRAHR